MIRNDAANVAFLEKQLQQVIPEVLRTEYRGLSAIEGRLFKVSAKGLQRWARSCKYDRVTRVSQFMPIRDLVTFAGSGANYLREEIILQLRDYGDSFTYSDDEIEAGRAQLQANVGVQLDDIREKTEAAREGGAQRANSVLLSGDYSNDLAGFVNHPDWPRIFCAYPFNSTSTADQITAQANVVITAVKKQTENRARVNKVALGVDPHRYIETVFPGTTNDSTIKDRIIKSNPGLQFEEVLECGESSADPTGKEVAVFYENDPSVIEGVVVLAFEVKPPQAQAFGYVVYCRCKLGGIHLKKPKYGAVLVGVNG